MKVSLSVVIITYNEERIIGKCLESVLKIADDIIVLDSFSMDKTKEICDQFNVRFIQHQFSGYVEQKNKALEYAKYKYVLSLDADEVVSRELQESILKIKDNWIYDGYEVSRLTNYCGKWIFHCGWYPEKKLRLWDISKGEWNGLLIHEKVKMKEGCHVQVLKGYLLHYSYYSIQQHMKKTEDFTTMQSLELLQKGENPSFCKLIYKPFWTFFRVYFIKRGFLDGVTGFIISVVSAFSTFLKYAKTKELINNQKELSDSKNTFL